MFRFPAQSLPLVTTGQRQFAELECEILLHLVTRFLRTPLGEGHRCVESVLQPIGVCVLSKLSDNEPKPFERSRFQPVSLSLNGVLVTNLENKWVTSF